MTGTPAMTAFAALLDRSVARIAALSADGRRFDRLAVARTADVWDNAVVPLIATALSRPARSRERGATAALCRLADAGAERRAWMVDEAAAAGHRLEALFPAPRPERPHHRDHRGQVRPGVIPVSAEAVAALERDYDVRRGEVRALRIERAGARLAGHVSVVAPRRYPASSIDTDPVVQLRLEDVRAVRFDSEDRAGVALTAGPNGVVVRFGDRGTVEAATASAGFEDSQWHLSGAGLAADAETPHDGGVRRPPPEFGRVPGAAGDAAVVLHQAMLEIRSVRYPHLVGRIPVGQLSSAFAGAGEGILAAAGRPWPLRDRAFRRLAEGWVGGVAGLRTRIRERFPDGHWVRSALPPDPLPPPSEELPHRAGLVLVRHDAEHVAHGAVRAAATVVCLGTPGDDDRWRLRAADVRGGPLRVSTEAFAGTHTVAGPLVFEGGALVAG